MKTNGNTLAVIVITRNEERNIVDCLESVRWVDEIVLVDSTSTDKTVELAKIYTKKIFVRDWTGYGPAKNFALEQVQSDWVLWLDADERVTPELTVEIRTLLKNSSNDVRVFEVARRAYFLGKWIKHCGWYPGYVVRLFRKGSAKFNSSQVHEKLEFQGEPGRLKNDLLHYTDRNLFHYVEKFNRYTSLASEELYQRGKTASLYDLTVRPAFMFFKMYFIRLGILDGMHGFILSLLSSAYVFVKYAKTWEIHHSGKD